MDGLKTQPAFSADVALRERLLCLCGEDSTLADEKIERRPVGQIFRIGKYAAATGRN